MSDKMAPIRALRIRKGVSQQTLADIVNVSQQTISYWENKNSIPDTRSAVLLAAYFGVPIEDLIGENTDSLEASL